MDLLNLRGDRGALPVRWKAERGFHVENLYHIQVSAAPPFFGCLASWQVASAPQCDSDRAMLDVLEEGLGNRRVASHQMNDRSSRR